MLFSFQWTVACTTHTGAQACRPMHRPHWRLGGHVGRREQRPIRSGASCSSQAPSGLFVDPCSTLAQYTASKGRLETLIHDHCTQRHAQGKRLPVLLGSPRWKAGQACGGHRALSVKALRLRVDAMLQALPRTQGTERPFVLCTKGRVFPGRQRRPRCTVGTSRRSC